MRRTADSIEATKGEQASKDVSGNKPNKSELKGKARRLANLVAPWTSETAPKSCGRPKKDMASIIARQVFENNPELLYKAYVKALAKGQAFAFQVLSDRAYGKLKEVKELSGPNGGPIELAESNDTDLDKRIADLERDLGLAGAIDQAGRVGSPQAGAGTKDDAAKDTPILS